MDWLERHGNDGVDVTVGREADAALPGRVVHEDDREAAPPQAMVGPYGVQLVGCVREDFTCVYLRDATSKLYVNDTPHDVRPDDVDLVVFPQNTDGPVAVERGRENGPSSAYICDNDTPDHTHVGALRGERRQALVEDLVADAISG